MPRLAHDRHTRKLSSVNSALPEGTAVSRSRPASRASRLERWATIGLFLPAISIACALLACALLGCALGGCGDETRGLVLGEVDSGFPITTIDAAGAVVDAGCGECDASSAVLLDGETTTAQHGGDGGVAYLDTCPGNQAVIGYQGYVALFDGGQELELVGRLQTVCGALSLEGPSMDQVVTTPGATLTARGETPDQAWTQMCPTNQIVVGFEGHSGQYLDRVAFTCAHWTAMHTANGTVLVRDAIDTASPQGGDGGTAFQESCPVGQVARGSAIRAGFWIDSLALICATPTL
jgi:hypothetical protein